MTISAAKYPVRAADIKLNVIALDVAIGATGAPTVSNGRGATIARTDVGDYTVTLDGHKGTTVLLFGTAFIHAQSDLDRTIVGKGVSTANGTFSFTVQAAATPTEAASGDTIQVVLLVNNTGRG